jgi:hypothetical protein
MAVNNLNTPGTGIQPTLVDAKGDLIAGVANDAVNRLAVGTNGQVLVADSGETTGLKWNNPGTVGGLVHIKQETGTTVSAINVNDCFSANFNNYFVTINLLGSTDAGLSCRLRVSGSDNSTSNYDSVQIAGVSNTVGSNTTASATSWSRYGNTSNNDAFITGYFSDPFNSKRTTFQTFQSGYITSGNSMLKIFAGIFNATTSFTGFTIFPSTGTITATINVFGVKNG